MRTQLDTPRTARGTIFRVVALTALSLAACKGKSDETSAGAVALTDTAAAAPAATAPAGDTAVTPAPPAAATPAAAKAAAPKPEAKAAAAEPASTPPPPPPKVYPPFNPNASAATIGVMVYPKKGQPIEQQQAEENECFAWAKTNTGIDPNAPPPAAVAPAEVAKGGTVKGAAKGAVAGVAIGAIAGDAGKGAAIGAAAGGMAGRRGQKKTEQAAVTNAEAQTAAAADAAKKKFADGFGVCMDGKGYSVK